MTFKIKQVCLLILLAHAFCATPSFGQKMGAGEAKQLIVETSHIYMRFVYEDPLIFVAGKSMPPLLEKTASEAVLVDYLTHLAKGEVEAAIRLWTVESQRLIHKRNASIPLSELAKSTIAQNANVSFRLISRIVYGEYIIIEIQAQGLQGQAKQAADSYGLKKEKGIWRLTQELADDPVMCCRDAPQARIRRVGVPGGNFLKVLEALNK